MGRGADKDFVWKGRNKNSFIIPDLYNQRLFLLQLAVKEDGRLNKEIPQNRKGQFGWSALMSLIVAFILVVVCNTCCSALTSNVGFYQSLINESNEKYALQYASSIDVLAPNGSISCGGTVIQRTKGKPMVVVSAAHCFHEVLKSVGKVEGKEAFELVDPTESIVQQCLGTVENSCLKWEMNIVRLDKDLDLALLIGKTPESFSGPYVHIAFNGPRIGDPIVMIGAPAGRSRNISTGVVSYISQETHTGEVLHYYTDAALYFGNSGGGMFNSSGELIGVAHTAFAPIYPIIIHGSAACIGLPHIQKITEGVFEERNK